MAMKTSLFVVTLLCMAHSLLSQKDSNTSSSALYVKLEPIELAYNFPRVGIGLEKKFSEHSIWGSFHYGSEELNFGDNLNYFSEPFTYWGLKAGIRRIYPGGVGEYFIGPHLSFDKVSAEITDDVFYDLRNKDAILFDKGTFHRNRVRLFFESGYDFFSRDRFTLEISGGAGISRIEIRYKNVENPFLLNDVEPRHYHRRSQHKYAGTIWKPALTASLKFGVRF